MTPQAATREAKKKNIPIAHVHTSSASALHNVLAKHLGIKAQAEGMA